MRSPARNIPKISLTPEERRERARLRSLRWRRAQGIGPRKPAERPWLALGISRSTPTTGGARKPAAKPRWPRQRPLAGGARPLGLADCGASREPRQARGCACNHGDGTGQLRSLLEVTSRASYKVSGWAIWGLWYMTGQLREDEKFVVDAMSKMFSGAWRCGDDPPDAYLMMDNREIGP
jgi:hypothetical protein